MDKKMNRIRRIGSLILIIVIFCACMPFASYAETSDNPDVSSVIGENILIMNMDTGMKLYEKNSDDPVYIGLLNRIMTVLLTVENIDDLENQKVTITSEMLEQTPQVSSANLARGEQLSVADLIQCVLIANSQEACIALAQTVAGDIDSFITMMNKRAEELGATHTSFSNVHGYYTYGQATTSLSDCSLIFTEVCKHDDILRWSSAAYADLNVSGKTRKIYSKNSIVVPNSSYYIKKAHGLGIYSGKGCPVSGANFVIDSGMRILCIEASSDSVASVYKDMKTLLKFSAEHYVTEKLLAASAAVCEIPVELAQSRDSIVAYAAEDIFVTHLDNVSLDDYQLVVDVPDKLTAPLSKGEELGTVSAVLDGRTEVTVKVVCKTSVDVDNMALFTKNLNDFFSNPVLWGILILVVVGVVVYSLLLWISSRKKLKRKKSDEHERIKMDID